MTGRKRMFVHAIEAEDAMSELPNTSKLNGDWHFLLHLHDIGERPDRLRIQDFQTNICDRIWCTVPKGRWPLRRSR